MVPESILAKNKTSRMAAIVRRIPLSKDPIFLRIMIVIW